LIIEGLLIGSFKQSDDKFDLQAVVKTAVCTQIAQDSIIISGYWNAPLF